MDYSFKNSIENNISVYYHFLDGLIGSNIGGEGYKVINTLSTFGIINPVDNQYINFLFPLITTSFNYLLNFKNVTNKFTIINFELNFRIEQDYTDEFLNYFRNYFCIFPTSFNNHLSSSIIFTKNDKLYFFILNSGAGINYNGSSKVINDKTLYQLTKGIVLSDNIQDKNNFIDGINKLKKILFISFFYKYIYDNKFKNDDLTINKSFFDFLCYLKSINYNINFLYNNKSYNIDNLPIYADTIFKFYDKLIISDTYYKLIANFLDIFCTPVNIKELNISDINVYHSKYNKYLIEFLKEQINIVDFFYEKIILYFEEDNFYIIDQLSSSCSWFAIYYSLMLFIIIFLDSTQYKNFINAINLKFYSYITNVFKLNNFNQEFVNGDILYMKKLCSKLIEINVIDKDILYESQDIIYRNPIYFKINSINNEIVSINKTILENYDFKNINIQEFIYIIDKIQKPINIFFLDAYNLYLEQRKGNFLFKKNFNIDLQSLKSLIKQDILIKFSENLEKILYYISQFKKTYSLDVSKYCPSYVFYFIPMIQYINYIYKEYYCGDFILDIEENKNDLFDCCILYIRLILISYILENIIPIKENYDMLINIIIIPLLETTNSNILEFKLKYYEINLPIDIYLVNNTYLIENKNLFLTYENFYNIIDDYLNFENYLYDNPNNITNEFLIYNIGRINKRQDIKEKLIIYFSQIYFLEKRNNNQKNTNTAEKLIILIYDYPGFYRENLAILISYSESIKNEILEKLSLLFYQFDNIDNFVDYISKNKKKIYNINKFELIPDYNYIDDKHYICGTQYNKYSNSLFLYNLFGDDIDILVSEIKENTIIYIYQIYYENIIKYECIYNYDNGIFYGLKFNKIFINDNEVIKFKDIILPFKYLIPITGHYFIYKKNNIYNVSFLVKKTFINPSMNKTYLLGEQKIYSGVYTFEINPNTQFFLNKFDNKSDNFNLWNKLCLDFQVNNYNILYINFRNCNQDNTGYSCSKNIYEHLCHFDKKNIIKQQINYELEDFNLLKKDIDDEPPLFEINLEEKKYTTISLQKLLFKISNCKIKENNKCYWENKLQRYKKRLNLEFNNFTKKIKSTNLNALLKDFKELQRYLLQVKIYNFIDKILINIDNERILCSLIKNYKFLFDIKKKSLNYKFELLFELISGNEILNEQNQRYNLMLKSYDDYKNRMSLKGGDYLFPVEGNIDNIDEEIKEKNCKNNYPLHHFMMGKGKSAIITPLLALYFSIIHHKEIYIIVPKHLVKQTEDTINDYLNIFEIYNINIFSEDEIKYYYLLNHINLDRGCVFLIDEFDSLISPLKSEYNIIFEKNINVKNIGIIIKNIIINFEEKLKNKINISECDIELLLIDDKIIKNKDIFIKNIISIINQINNDTLKLNINWGIDKNKLYAIPYRNKDKPIEKSSFSSIILTIFLTYYYYIIINKSKIDNNIFNFIKINNFHKSLFNLDIDEFKLTIEKINESLFQNTEYNKLLLEKIDKKIFDNLLLPKFQFNTSFVDIINMDNIFKISYSGTVDMNLPILYSQYTFNKNCLYEDEDESTNVEYAILNSVINRNNIKNILEECFLDIYDAIIDVCGYFKDITNSEVALKINTLLHRDIIFIDENDNKMIIINNNLGKYNEYNNYVNPFFYYDQAHTVGIDIKQDNYPILKGLCIEDKYSTYTEVAQSMYRLRKLNIGHTISFILYNFNDDIDNTTQLLKKFRDNQKELIYKQQKNLNIQALKSDFRKQQIVLEGLAGRIKNHKEDLFHYFLDDKLSVNPLQLIFKDLDISRIDLCSYELDINDIKNMIYKVNMDNIETQLDKETEKKSEQNIYDILLDYNDLFLFNFTNFKNYDFIKKITSNNFDDYTFKIDDNISFLPNIFKSNNDSFISLYSYNNKNINETDLIFIYFNFGKFLVAPRYLTTFLYNDFILLDLNLIKININKDIINLEQIKNLKKNNIFIKIINNNFTDDELDCFLLDDNNIIYIKILIFLIKKNIILNDKIYNFYNNHKEIIKSNSERFFNTPKNQDIICNLTPYFRHKIILPIFGGSDIFFKKYLKYKNKYIQLKNK